MTDSSIFEYENELSVNLRVIEAVPEDKLPWLPHKKSLSIGSLARHLAIIRGKVPNILSLDTSDIKNAKPDFTSCATKAELIEIYETNPASGLSWVKSLSSNQLPENWTLTGNGSVIMQLPRGA